MKNNLTNQNQIRKKIFAHVEGRRGVTNRIKHVMVCHTWEKIICKSLNGIVISENQYYTRDGDENASIGATNLPQFCRVKYSATSTLVNSFNARKMLGRLKSAVYTRNTLWLIRDNNPRARAYAYTRITAMNIYIEFG